MELRSAERPQGRARVPREFSRLDTRSPTQSAAIQLFNTVLFSGRARPKLKVRACPRQGSAALQIDRSAKAFPREFCRPEGSSNTDSQATQAFRFVAVSERAGSRARMGKQFIPPTPNQPVEGTPSRCALRRPSPAR